MHSLRLTPALLVAAACLIFTSSAGAQATRTWVSGVGDDANPCSRTAPCKTFAGAITKTAAGGEINATDPGPFGAVNITKAITLDIEGYTGGVLNTLTNGVVINAGETDSVVLRGLDVFGGNGAGCGYGGSSGVKVLQAGTVRIEDTTITRQQKAIEVAPTSAASVLVNRVEVTDNCTHGIRVAPTGAGSAAVTIRNSTISNSGTALSVADGGAAWLTGALLFDNALGLQATGTGQINDFGDNRLVANTVDGAATADLTPQPPAGPAGPTGATGATGAQGPAGEPAVKLLLAVARTKLAAKAGKAVVINYGSTTRATSTLTIRLGGKRVAAVRSGAKAGANTIRWSGKIGKKPAAAGAYKLTLRAVGADGQVDTATLALTLRRR